jgi:phosphoribosylformimino-5-aminoimidazole carboxamide ribotide isomerase
MIIIPAIDIIDGKCVRLSQGDFTQQKVYSENPLEMALSFQDAGLKYLHLVDLDGAKEGNVKNWEVVKSITEKTTLNVDFGGGIKTEGEISKLIEMGVQQVNLGSIAFKEPAKMKGWIEKFGRERIILSADSNREKLAVAGWQSQTGVSVIEFIQDFVQAGLQYATCTDIAKDGMLAGPNVELYKKILNEIPSLKLIASGGVSSLLDLEKLKSSGCYGSIVGKAIYEGSISLKDLSEFNSSVNPAPSLPDRQASVRNKE